MTALTAGRNTKELQGDVRQGGLAAAVVVFAGAIVMRNAAGFLTKGETALNLIGAGRAEESKTGGANAGDVALVHKPGIFRFANSAAADEITIADVGKPAYAVDDQTVAKTSGTNTRSIAGFVHDVDEIGVWVRFDEALVQSYLAGTTLPL